MENVHPRTPFLKIFFVHIESVNFICMDTCQIFFKKQFLSSAEEKVIQVLNDKKVKKR